MKQTILLIILFLLLCCLSLHAIHVLIFHQSGFTVIYIVYMLVREQRSEGSPPRCLHFPSNNYILYDECSLNYNSQTFY